MEKYGLTDLFPIKGNVRITPRNMYITKDEMYEYDYAWSNFPGWSRYTENLGSELRGAAIHKNVMIVVAGNKVYSISKGGGYRHVGSILTFTGHVSVASNGIEVMLADGVSMYRYDGTTVLPQVVPFSNAPSRVLFHDGFFISFEPGTGQFFISDKFNGTVWNALQFATAEDKPDDIVEIHSDRLLWIFGENSTQAYDNTGGVFPFQPNYQGRLLYGARGRTVASLDNTTYWLGSSKDGSLGVFRIQGFAPEPVSIPKYEKLWSSFTDIDEAYASSFAWERSEFYVLTFPVSRRSFVYDPRSKVWSEWGVWKEALNKHIEHPAKMFIYFDNKMLFGDSSGDIMELSKSTTYHNGEANIRELEIQVMRMGNQRYSINELWLTSNAGEHSASLEPEIMLSISQDKGHSFGNWIRAMYGRSGQYDTRLRWLRLGSGYDPVLKVRISDDMDWRITAGGIV